MKYEILEPISEKELSKIDTPITIKNKELMAPGVWNDTNYTAEEIHDAFINTNWKDKDNISLFLDHKDLETSNWVGWVKNPRLVGDRLLGDLEVWDENIARKLVLAKAKFGISPKLKGMEDTEGSLRNFTYKNFSVVTKPAVRTAYINLIQKEDKLSFEQNKKEGGKLNMPEEEVKKPEEGKEDKAPVEDTKETQEDKEDETKKKPGEEEMSEEAMLEVTQNPAWSNFVKKMKESNPKMPFKEIANAFKKDNKDKEELENMSESDLIGKVDSLLSILKSRKKDLTDDEKKKEEEKKEEKKEKQMKELKSEIKELRSKIDREPNSVVTKALSYNNSIPVNNASMAPTPSRGVLAMAEFLKKEVVGK